ncbi:hypothetical protein FRB99_005007 [Tulasnella sp. 403]|nr:hypothetical protein FRB99_005007 [Tulasnella sp. 403]
MDWPAVANLVEQRPWYKNRGIVMVNLCVLLALLTSFTNGFDGSMVNGLQLVEQWQDYFHDPSGPTLGLMTSVQNIGGLVALPFAPLITDGLGRRKAIFIGGFLMLNGVALQSQAHNIVQFISARALLGFGMAFSVNAAPLLVTELAYPTQRGSITAIYNSTWYVGSIFSAWITFGTFRIANSTWAWRIPSILQAIPSLLQCVLIWFCPESPRWLASKGRDEEAKEVLGKYHGDGDSYHPLVDYEYKEIRQALAIEEQFGHVSWWSLVATPGNRRRMRVIIALGFFSQWSGNGLVSYYMNLILETVGIEEAGTKTMINGILQVFNFGMAITSALFVERIGRRRLFLISNSGMLLVFIGWTITSALFEETHSKIAGNFTIVIIFLYYAFYDIAWTPLLVAYCIEILPFRIRAKGFAVMSFTISLALIFNQYVNPIALTKLGWKYYIFYVGWLAFELVFVFVYFRETRGKTLEQTAMLFDGDTAKDPFFMMEADVAGHQRQSHKVVPPPSDRHNCEHGLASPHAYVRNGSQCHNYPEAVAVKLGRRPATASTAQTVTTAASEFYEMKVRYEYLSPHNEKY